MEYIYSFYWFFSCGGLCLVRMPVVSALWRWNQKDSKFKVNLGCTVRLPQCTSGRMLVKPCSIGFSPLYFRLWNGNVYTRRKKKDIFFLEEIYLRLHRKSKWEKHKRNKYWLKSAQHPTMNIVKAKDNVKIKRLLLIIKEKLNRKIS